MLRRCVKCGLPETYETIEFNSKGICNICTQKVFKDTEIDWELRKQILNDLIEEYRGKYDYDCIVPFSGGKDSTYTLNYLVREYKLKPLVVQFNHGFMRETLLKNNERTFKKLGVDVLSFTPNWKVVKRLMKEALIRKGDFCWHCHTGIFAYPMQIAIKFNVPLVFWGEPSSEYTAYYDYKDNEIEEVDEDRFNRYVNLGITAEDMEGMIKNDFELDSRDLNPYMYPKLRDLKKIRYRSVCLGSYIPWDVKRNVEEIKSELGWQGDEVEGIPFEAYPYEKIECYMQGVRDYIKYLKRGYSRVTQMTALDLRNERITKREADKLIEDFEGRKPPSLDLFLEYLEISEDEFNEIVSKTVVAPHIPDFKNIEIAPKTWDFEHWYREKK
ncbi:N-acetyl sugar amidotransferase [Paenibacillus thalictri]|uniref:N-acetyl sugar amidotransferase n=1 Tax=Paenibacillus thalictri TaxID=2527873 RepID=A0A4Q9DC71_9BACL|nr:N-acetyl sugar amidotransferase [Paenibacillus thalictri]TBL67782.1 N-acetyl sugar amidotransferase [Paenibacillus thalictri]